MTSNKRVSIYRNNLKIDQKKIIEVTLKKEEVSILEALASREGMSRNLYVSRFLSDLVRISGYYLKDGHLHSTN